MNTPIADNLIVLLRNSERVTALTGAGISKESGLDTFREAQTGLWSRYRPEDLATAEAFQRNPQLVWDWYAERRRKAQAAMPNPGHLALAEMGRRLPDFVLVTQNVDGLHQKAGSRGVIELHGNIHRVKCFDCGTPADAWEETNGEVPPCTRCGGPLRPDVVWFGEALPRAALEESWRAASNCQVFFSIGTSGLVQPAASLALRAQECGAVVVEVNTEATPLTPHTDFFLEGKAGEMLPGLVEAAWG